MYFNYDHVHLRYEPFPVGLAKPLMEEDLYRQLVDQYPPTELFKTLPKFGNKYSLSEKYHARQYRQFIRSNPLWRELHAWLKSDDFIYGVLKMLAERHIDLGFGFSPLSFPERLAKGLRRVAQGKPFIWPPKLTTRFEFSMLPAQGGHVLPHVDNPEKIVTHVVSMLHEDEWKPEYGGGTSINRAKEDRFKYNKINRQAQLEDMEVIDTFPFTPNQAVIFTPTFNSWHSVQRMNADIPGLMRRTLTIVIESSS
jgi:hypothetical protein